MSVDSTFDSPSRNHYFKLKSAKEGIIKISQLKKKTKNEGKGKIGRKEKTRKKKIKKEQKGKKGKKRKKKKNGNK